jgi:hypothetical protein
MIIASILLTVNYITFFGKIRGDKRMNRNLVVHLFRRAGRSGFFYEVIQIDVCRQGAINKKINSWHAKGKDNEDKTEHPIHVGYVSLPVVPDSILFIDYGHIIKTIKDRVSPIMFPTQTSRITKIVFMIENKELKDLTWDSTQPDRNIDLEEYFSTS